MDMVSGEEEEKDSVSLEHSYPQHDPGGMLFGREGERGGHFPLMKVFVFGNPPPPIYDPQLLLLPSFSQWERMRRRRGKEGEWQML